MRMGDMMRFGMRRTRLIRNLGGVGVTLALVLAPTAASALSPTAAHTPGPPTRTHGVKPTLTVGSITNCPKGTTKFIKVTNPRPGHETARYSHNGTTFRTKVNRKETFLSFLTNASGFTIYIGIQPAYDTYNYAGTTAHPAYHSDTGLHPPFDTDGTIDPITYYLVCGKAAVSKAQPTLTTTPSPGGPTGVILNDTAKLARGASPTGSITFKLYNPSHAGCTGTPAYTKTVTVSGNGRYSTTNTAPAKTAGKWNWTATYTGDSRNKRASSGCGKETVTVTKKVAQGSCEGSGSISALVSGKNVTAYVPKGNWGSGATGIDVVNVEGTSIKNTTIKTGSDVINSCASNSVTGLTVCTANNTDVYVLKGTALDPSVSPNPLTDGGSGTITFSGGTATTTGVSMDATDNKALIALSVGSVGGFQFLDLATGKFEPAFTTKDPGRQISEDPLIDPVHHLILSAAEDDNYELVNVSTSTSPKFFEHPVPPISGALDSSAEDCSTGIIFAPAEGSSPTQIDIADITHAKFTSGNPGSWTAPEQVQTLTGSTLNAGGSGSAVAQGTHTGVVSGEFGGDALTALALPTTSSAGTPAVGNWVSCQTGPDPSGNPFSMGDDPHTLAAYQSPNGGHAIALLVNEGATEMARVDLTDMLGLPATGKVCKSTTIPSSAEKFIPLP